MLMAVESSMNLHCEPSSSIINFIYKIFPNFLKTEKKTPNNLIN